MRVLLYSENAKLFSKSGIGIALQHQQQALNRIGVKFTLNWRSDYDIAHINTVGPGSKRVLKNSRKKGKPVVWHVHTTFEDIRNSFLFSNAYARLVRRWLVKLYSSADYLIFPTKYTETLIRNYGIDIPGSVISNGVDTSFFQRNEELARHFKREYNVGSSLILCVGFPFKRKGIHDFVEIATRLPEHTFIWFGAKIAGVLPPAIRKVLRNPPKNVVFPGYIEQKKLVGAYSAADVFLFPSYEENEGIVVLEALSTQCPVVVRDIPVFNEWLKDGFNCLKAKSVDEFAEKVQLLLSDKSLSKTLAVNARATALERDLTSIGETLKSVYEKILSQ